MSTNQDNILEHEIRIDTRRMEDDINRGVAQFERLGDAASREGRNIEKAMSNIGTMTAAYFSVQALRSFAADIVRVRGEIESLEISFETLLGSKDKAEELFGAIREFAVQTPMTMDALASGAQTLLGFGIEAEKVMPILQSIGDISMGDAQKFNSLTLAFAQASSAGKLAGQDFLQMVNAGFNPLNEMAKQTGKSIKELKEDMENGAIKTEQLEAAFLSATAEGGMFHDMLKKQSQGIQGALSNLQGAWDDMLNDIGSKQQSVFVSGVNILTDLVKNYETFANAILSVAAAYGTYKAALMAVWVIEKARAVSESIQLIMMFRKELGLLTAAQQAFNTSAWANPYVLLAAAIVGVITAMTLYIDRTSKAEKVQKSLNDRRDEFKNSLEDEMSQIERYIGIIKDENETAEMKLMAYARLKNLAPEITDAYTREALCAADLAETTKELNKVRDDRTFTDTVERYREAKSVLDELMNSQQGNNGTWGGVSEATRKMLSDMGLTGQTIDKAIDDYRKLVYEPIRDEYEELRQFREEAADTRPVKVRIETKLERINNLEEQQKIYENDLTTLKRRFETEPTIFTMQLIAQVQVDKEKVEAELKKAKDEVAAMTDNSTTYKQAYDDAQKAYNKAYKTLAEMKKNRDQYTQEQYIAAKETLDTAKKKFEELGGEVKSDKELTNDAKKQAELLVEVGKARTDMQLKIEEEQLKIVEDGREKRLSAIELERQQALAAIDKEQTDFEKKLKESKQSMTADDKTAFESRRDAVNATAAYKTRQVEKENAEYIAGLYRTLSEVFETEEQRKISAIQERYKEQRKQLLKDKNSGNISDTQYDDLLGKTNAAEAKEMEDVWLEAYGDYYQKRQSLQTEWESNLAKIPAKYVEQARRQMESELSAMDVEQFKKTFNWDMMFGDLNNQSIDSLQYTLERVKRKFDEMKGSMTVTEIRDWQDAMTNLENEIASRNPFTALHKSFKDISTAKGELVTALQEMRDAQTELTEAQNNYNVALEEEKALREQVDGGTIAADDERIVSAEANLADARNRLNKATERSNKAETNGVKARNNVTKSYKQYAANLKSCGAVVTDLGGKASKMASIFSDDIADSMDKAISFVGDVLDATSDCINALGDVGKSVAKSMTTTVDAMGNATESTAKATATSISTVEKASVILTVISAALQIATSIASLFNNDDEKQKEIEKLQARIDQLQWELDNADAVRLQKNNVDALQKLREVYSSVTAEVIRLHTSTTRSSVWSYYFTKAKYSADIYAKTIEKIADYWGSVNYSSDKALGSAKYDESRKQLENLAEQQMLVYQQMNEESAKKKSDSSAIADYKNKIAELAEEMATLINDMMEDIIGTTAEDLASTLGDAFFEAVAAGEDAMEAWAETTNDLVSDIIKRMMITKYLEPKIGEIFDRYKSSWFGTDGTFKGIQAVIDSADNMANDINQVGEEFNAVWEGLSSSLGKWFDDDSDREASSKGIATASQDSVDENNARLTTIQGHTYTLVQSVTELNATANAMLDRLTGIERNTDAANDKLDAVNTHIKVVRTVVEDMQTHGLKIK
jgi:tape measure domain-containing protein